MCQSCDTTHQAKRSVHTLFIGLEILQLPHTTIIAAIVERHGLDKPLDRHRDFAHDFDRAICTSASGSVCDFRLWIVNFAGLRASPDEEGWVKLAGRFGVLVDPGGDGVIVFGRDGELFHADCVVVRCLGGGGGGSGMSG